MYGIFTYIWLTLFLMGHLGKYTIHGSTGIYNHPIGKEYKWYISGIFPANWVIISPTTYQGNQKQLLLKSLETDSHGTVRDWSIYLECMNFVDFYGQFVG